MKDTQMFICKYQNHIYFKSKMADLNKLKLCGHNLIYLQQGGFDPKNS